MRRTTSASATADAASAAAQAGVLVAVAEKMDDIAVLRDIVHRIWGPQVVPPTNLLRGIALAGPTLLIARRDGEPVGFAVGVIGVSGGLHLHSHQVGVTAEARGGGVGAALKLAQRQHCLEFGVTEMRWTFDPLLAGNARFNLGRLGACVTRFLPACYGARVDAFNTGDTTDRVEVSWLLDRRDPYGETASLAAEGPALIEMEASSPVRSSHRPKEGATIALPPDYHALRAGDPATARVWRLAVGCALTDVFTCGFTVGAFAEGRYVITRRAGIGP